MKISPPLAITGIIAASFAWMAWEYEAPKLSRSLVAELKNIASAAIDVSFMDDRLVYMGGVPKVCEPPFGRLPNGLCAVSLEKFRAYSPRHSHTFFGGVPKGGDKTRIAFDTIRNPNVPIMRTIYYSTTPVYWLCEDGSREPVVRDQPNHCPQALAGKTTP